MGYSVCWEKYGACIVYAGTVVFQDFMGAVLDIHESSEYARLRYVIHDMSGADRIDFASVDMTMLVAHELGARYTNPNIKASIVATDRTMSGMVHVFVDLTKLDVRVYDNLEQARCWSAQTEPARTSW